MKILKKTFRLFAVALLIAILAFSFAACKNDDKNNGANDNVGGIEGGDNSPEDNIPPEVAGDTSGIDWTKYWDGTTAGSGSDGFTFDRSVSIGDVSSSPVTGGTSSNLGEGYTVSFNSNGGEAVSAQSVDEGGMVVKPSTPVKSGNMFVNWYEDSSLSTVYDFSTPVTQSTTLYAKWAAFTSSAIKNVYAYNESLAVEFTGTTSSTVQYKAKNASDWSTVDAPLVRSIGSGVVRADIVGLAAGEYNVKVDGTELPAPVSVDAYDRSGYAHFQYSEGVGAYNDNGTIKSNALVLYLTEDNKNTINTGYVNGAEVSLAQYLTEEGGTVHEGIGEILNNRRYSGNDRMNVGIARLCKEYGAVVVRVLGTVSAEDASNCKVSTINGLTDYDSTENGGSEGDNGRMARMVNAKNLTIEGIGEDACIYGWGVHFIHSESTDNSVGKNFEVRNLTFSHYPEDAVGMEGEQKSKSTSSELNVPVQRCWVHNNTFLPGYCATPTENDKAEGDGSCDFKRGQYFTCSYNYFTDCHKTNLVGSASYSQTYNLTFHHNWWNQCGSRQFMGRQANVHYYNNYIFQDMTTKPSGVTFNHIIDIRSYGYVFLEANYFDGAKNVTLTSGENGGAAKAYQNIYYACSGTDSATHVDSRTDTVTNSCKYEYGNIDYSHFDTNPSQFYYDATNKVSECLLDSATSARLRVMMYAGVNGFGQKSSQTQINKYTPTSAVQVDETNETSVSIPTAKGDYEVNGVLFKGFTGSQKGKGQIITFKLTAPTEVVITTSSTGDNAPELLDSYGRLWAHRFEGKLTIVLPQGTYVISTGLKDKESTITSLSFADTEASAEARIAAANNALAAIPNTLTLNDEVYIKEAQEAYSALRTDEASQIDSELYEKLGKAITAINQLKVEYVIARIDYIGTVDITSYDKINAAQTAFNELTATTQAQVTNYSTLTAAWTAYGQFAVQNVINKILDLPEVENIQKINSIEILERAEIWFEAVSNAFDTLTSEEGAGQQGQVKAHDGGKTFARLTEGFAAINTRRAEIEKAAAEAEALDNFISALEAVTDASALSLSECNNIISLYSSLSEEKQAEYAENATFAAIKTKHEELSSQAKKLSFTVGTDGYNNSEFTVEGSNRTQASETVTVDGVTYTTSLKMEGSTPRVTFTTTTKMTLVLYFLPGSGKKVNIDGTAYDIGSDGVLTLTIESGTHTIVKNTTNTYLFLVELVPSNN